MTAIDRACDEAERQQQRLGPLRSNQFWDLNFRPFVHWPAEGCKIGSAGRSPVGIEPFEMVLRNKTWTDADRFDPEVQPVGLVARNGDDRAQ